MATMKRYLGMFLAGLLGAALTLAAWRLVNDYQDFLKMRQWVAQMQDAQKQAMQAQQQARPPAPSPPAK